MVRKENPSSLLLNMQMGAATVENSVEFLQEKVKMKVIQDDRGVEIALTSSQDQSGIAAKLWSNRPEQTTKQ